MNELSRWAGRTLARNDANKHGLQKELITHNVNPDALQGLILQKKLATVWKELDPDSEVTWLPSIEDAVDYVKEIYNGALKEPGAEILVTGSFHLVGGWVLSLIDGVPRMLETAVEY